jgi:hypothetical protein
MGWSIGFGVGPVRYSTRLSGRRRRRGSGGGGGGGDQAALVGCVGVLVGLFVAVSAIVAAFRHAPVLSISITLGLVALLVWYLRRDSVKNRKIREAKAAAEERERLDVLRTAAEDAEDGVLFTVGTWRVTEIHLIEGLGATASRYELAGMRAAVDRGYLVMTVPGGVGLLQTLDEAGLDEAGANRWISVFNDWTSGM